MGSSDVGRHCKTTVKPLQFVYYFYQPLEILVLGFGTILLVFNTEQQDRRRGGTRNNHDEVKKGTRNDHDEVKGGTRLKQKQIRERYF